jgi:WD40 repeat protein
VTIAGQALYLWSRQRVDRTIPTELAGEPVAASFSNDGKVVFAAAEHAVHAYDDASGTLVNQIPVEVPTALAVAADNQQIAVGTARGEVVLYALQTPPLETSRVQAASGRITALAFDPSSRELAWAAQSDAGSSAVGRRELASGSERLNRQVPGLVVAVGIDGDGRLVVGVNEPRSYLASSADATASDGRTVLRLLDEIDGGATPGNSIGSQPTIGARMSSAPAVPALPPPDTPPPPTTTQPPPWVDATPPALLAPPTLPTVPVASEPESTSECQAGSASISRDFTLGAATTSCEREVMRWNHPSGDPYPLKLGRPVARVAVSQDGNYMAVAFMDGTIWMYHTDLPSRHALMQSAGPRVSGLAFDPSSTRLVAVRGDRTLAIYPFGGGALTEIAQEIVGTRQPTPAECTRVLGPETPCDDVDSMRLLGRSIWQALRGR